MSGLELRARREALGLSQSECARLFGTTQATLSRWEAGKNPISDWVWPRIVEMEEAVETLIDNALEVLDQLDDGGVLFAWEDDASFLRAHPEMDGIPASIHRVAMARARMMADDPSKVSIGPKP